MIDSALGVQDDDQLRSMSSNLGVQDDDQLWFMSSHFSFLAYKVKGRETARAEGVQKKVKLSGTDTEDCFIIQQGPDAAFTIYIYRRAHEVREPVEGHIRYENRMFKHDRTAEDLFSILGEQSSFSAGVDLF
jgi:hypothetical protein